MFIFQLLLSILIFIPKMGLLTIIMLYLMFTSSGEILMIGGRNCTCEPPQERTWLEFGLQTSVSLMPGYYGTVGKAVSTGCYNKRGTNCAMGTTFLILDLSTGDIARLAEKGADTHDTNITFMFTIAYHVQFVLITLRWRYLDIEQTVYPPRVIDIPHLHSLLLIAASYSSIYSVMGMVGMV
jgi:hypothetical protein